MDEGVQSLADAWIELTILGDGAPPDMFERGFRLNDEAYNRPAFAWDVITNIVSRFSEPDLLSDNPTEAKHVLSQLGAGPLECLLAQHGPDYIEKVEAEARRDGRFFWTLGCVWQNAMSAEVWSRVQKAGGNISR